MYKRAFLLLFSIVAMAGGMQAQTDSVPAAPAKATHWTFGLAAGIDRNYHQIDMSYMSDMKYDKYCEGITSAFSVTYNPWKWIGLRADVALVQKNYHLDHVSRVGERTIITQSTTENDYVNVPLVLDFSFGRAVRIHLMGGGYVGYWLSSHRTGKSYSLTYYSMGGDDSANDFDEDVPFNETRDNRLDAGFTWGVGAGVKVWRELRVNAEVRWYYGVLDIQNDYMRHLNPRYNTTLAFQGGVSWSL